MAFQKNNEIMKKAGNYEQAGITPGTSSCYHFLNNLFLHVVRLSQSKVTWKAEQTYMKTREFQMRPGLTCSNLSAQLWLTQQISRDHPFSMYAKTSKISTSLLHLLHKHSHLRTPFPNAFMLVVFSSLPNFNIYLLCTSQWNCCRT